MQNLAEYRIEEGFRQFGLLVVGQQADILQLRLLPDAVTQTVCIKIAMQPLRGFPDAIIIKLDAVPDRLLAFLPVRLFEPLLGK